MTDTQDGNGHGLIPALEVDTNSEVTTGNSSSSKGTIGTKKLRKTKQRILRSQSLIHRKAKATAPTENILRNLRRLGDINRSTPPSGNNSHNNNPMSLLVNGPTTGGPTLNTATGVVWSTAPTINMLPTFSSSINRTESNRNQENILNESPQAKISKIEGDVGLLNKKMVTIENQLADLITTLKEVNLKQSGSSPKTPRLINESPQRLTRSPRHSGNNHGYGDSSAVVTQHITPKEPPKFGGEMRAAARWLLEYKMVANKNHWSERTRIRQILDSLEHAAISWYRTTWQGEEPYDWIEFEDEFKRVFINDEVDNILKMELKSISQKKSEDILQYFYRALELCLLVDNRMNDSEKIPLIINGLHLEPRTIIRCQRPRNMIQLQEAISLWAKEHPSNTTKLKEDSPKSSETSINRKARSKEENYCLNCGKKGHYTRGCDKPYNEEICNKRREEWKTNPPFRAAKSRDPQGPDNKNNRANASIIEEDQNQQEEEKAIKQQRICFENPPKRLNPPIDFDLRAILALKDKQSRVITITCRLNGQQEEVILDTGASVTVLPLSLIESTKTPIYEWKGNKLRMANGTLQLPLGWCELSVEYDDRIHTITAVILTEAPEILLGADYILKSGLVIDMAESTALFHDHYMKNAERFLKRIQPVKTGISTQTEESENTKASWLSNMRLTVNQVDKQKDTSKEDFPFIEYLKEESESIRTSRIATQKAEIHVKSKNSITVPPKSIVRINAKISTSRDSEEIYLIESEAKGTLRALPGIAKKHRTTLEVANMGNYPVTVKRRELLARAVPLQEEQESQTLKTTKMNTEQQQQLQTLMNRHRDLMVDQSEAIGIVPGIKHKINTGETPPIRAKPYKVSTIERDKIQNLIQEMLDADIIRPSKSHWASPIVLVKKKGTTELRFCVDYRKLNKITRVDPYPIPNMDTVLENLSGNHWFSKLDIKSMYWQVLMDEKDREKTAFVVHCGQYEFNVMPFGLVSAPMTAMRVMDEVTRNLERYCFAFYDDILIYTNTFEEHLMALDEIFSRLDRHNIKLNAKKCELLLESVIYLGHIVSPQGISPDPTKVESIKLFPTPKTVKQARSFIGMANFFRKYIKGFANIARPIHDSINTGDPIQWTQKAQEAMEELKTKLTTAPVLIHIDHNGKLTIRCDASGYGIGAVLLQDSEDPTKKGVIAYTSRTLSKSEKAYGTTHKECLAMVHSVTTWRNYLYGKHFDVITDHHALCWLMSTKDPYGQLIRWSLILQEFDFTVKYNSGKLHADADCLSRFPLEVGEEAKIESEIPTWPLHKLKNSKTTVGRLEQTKELILPNYDIEHEQLHDEYCKKIIRILTDNQASRKLKKKFKHFVIKNNTLYRQSKIQPNKFILVLPSSMKNMVLEEVHDKPIGGHFGVERTMHTIRNRFYWPDLDKDVKQYIKTCDSCQRKKVSCNKQPGIMMPISIPENIFEKIGLDLMGPIPQSSKKNEHIIVATDYLSKYVVIQAIRKATTENVINFLKEKMFYTHGIPRIIITDNGTNLCSNQMRDVLKLMGIEHKTTSVYRPQTNGQTERYNRVLGTQLAIFAEHKQRTWDNYLQALAFAYNTTKHSSHQMTPFYLVYGRNPTKPLDLVIPKPLEDETGLIETEIDTISEARKFARTLITSKQLDRKNRYEKERKAPSFKVGDLVKRHKYPPERTGAKKFQFEFTEPYKIVKKLNELNYQISPYGWNGDEIIVHSDQIAPYYPRRMHTLQEGEASEEDQPVEVININ